MILARVEADFSSLTTLTEDEDWTYSIHWSATPLIEFQWPFLKKFSYKVNPKNVSNFSQRAEFKMAAGFKPRPANLGNRKTLRLGLDVQPIHWCIYTLKTEPYTMQHTYTAHLHMSINIMFLNNIVHH